MAQVVEHLPHKCEAFSSNPSTTKKKKKRKKETTVKKTLKFALFFSIPTAYVFYTYCTLLILGLNKCWIPYS
jgi:hypothetical protein